MIKPTFLATLLLATTSAQAIEPLTALSVVSTVVTLPEKLTGTHSTMGIGEFAFGPNISENAACDEAETRAKIDAIRKVIGENLSANVSNQCVNTNCIYKSDITKLTDAHLKSYTITEKKISNVAYGKSCKVKIEARVSERRPYADMTIDGRFFYKDGDPMKFVINTTDRGHLYVFSIEGKKATRLFPNQWSINSEVVNSGFVLPTSEYTMIAKASRFDETLVFVLSKDRINFLDHYKTDELNDTLQSLPVNRRKIIRHNLVIEQ